MFGRKKPEVVVAGAGPVGLFAALTLARRGIRVLVADEGWRTAAHSYALALHPSSLKLLRKADLADEVVKASHKVTSVGFYDATERRCGVDFSALGGEFPFVAVLPQNRLEDILESALETHGVNVNWNHRLSRLAQVPDADHVEVTIDRMTMESLGYAVAHTEWVVASSQDYVVPFVVGADGHGSMVRRSLSIDFESAGRTRHFAVFEIRTDFDTGNETRVVLGDKTTSVLWPLGNGHCRWSFELADFTVPPATRRKDRFLVQREETNELTEDNLRSLIKSRAPWFTGSIDKIEWRTVVRFEQRLAAMFGAGRAWLVGDSAHMVLPVSIQSMNVGIREASDVGELVADVLRDNGDADKIAHSAAASLAGWRRLLGLEGSVVAGADAPEWVRDNARRLATSIPASGKDLDDVLGHIGLSLTAE